MTITHLQYGAYESEKTTIALENIVEGDPIYDAIPYETDSDSSIYVVKTDKRDIKNLDLDPAEYKYAVVPAGAIIQYQLYAWDIYLTTTFQEAKEIADELGK